MLTIFDTLNTAQLAEIGFDTRKIHLILKTFVDIYLGYFFSEALVPRVIDIAMNENMQNSFWYVINRCLQLLKFDNLPFFVSVAQF